MGVYRSKFHYRDGVQYVDTRFDAAVRPLCSLGQQPGKPGLDNGSHRARRVRPV
jgi:hypothetical protein